MKKSNAIFINARFIATACLILASAVFTAMFIVYFTNILDNKYLLIIFTALILLGFFTGAIFFLSYTKLYFSNFTTSAIKKSDNAQQNLKKQFIKTVSQIDLILLETSFQSI